MRKRFHVSLGPNSQTNRASKILELFVKVNMYGILAFTILTPNLSHTELEFTHSLTHALMPSRSQHMA